MILRATFLFLFFASGFAALVYQVIWQRLLTFVTGTDAHSVTIIVAAFMVGLGLGSLAGGHIADRLTGRTRLWAFAGCEFAIAVFALVSVTVYYDVIYVRYGARDLGPLATASLGGAATLWPTFFMGLSFPLAARVLTDDARQPARWVPILYGWNTLGAATGAVVAVTVLLPSIGFERIVQIGALINAGCGVAACVLAASRLPGGSVLVGAPAATGGRDESRPRESLPLWLAVFGLSGFVALALEIAWFRLLGVILKSNASTFGQLLLLYLGGIGLGSLAAQTHIARRWPAARSFFILQAAVPIYSALALAVFVNAVGRLPLTGRVWTHLAAYDGLTPGHWMSATVVMVGVLVPLWLVGVPTFLMGLSFGSLQRAVQSDVTVLGRRVGWLQAANIAGAACGALVTGYVLLDRLGTTGTLRVLVAAAGFFLWLALRDHERVRRERAIFAAAIVAVATMAAVPAPAFLWPQLHGVSGGPAIFAEDSSGVALLRDVDGSTIVVRANGLGQSELPYGGIHAELGALPVMLHPNPKRVAVIGLGSGSTTFSIGGRPETTQIDSIEIVAPVLAVLQELTRTKPYPGLAQLLADPRVHHYMTDGRAYLAKTSQRYDVIGADALRPSSAYAGNLYSVEYFSLLRERLNPGGFAVTGVPTDRVRDSLRAAFPYVVVWDEIAIASDRLVPIDSAAIRMRMMHPYTQAYYRSAGVDLAALLEEYLVQPPDVFSRRDSPVLRTDLNEDLFPRDEFSVR